MATMEDVAKAAKVSRATVSRVLSNYPSIKPETRQQVMYWVRELHYEPNQVAQNLAGHHTNLIGVLFSDLSNPLYAALSTAIIREAEREGYSVIVGDAQRERAREVNSAEKWTALLCVPSAAPTRNCIKNCQSQWSACIR